MIFLKTSLFAFIFILASTLSAQNLASVKGIISSDSVRLSYAQIGLKGTKYGAVSDENGRYHIQAIPAGTYILQVKLIGYSQEEKKITVKGNDSLEINFNLAENGAISTEIVISGTLSPVTRDKSPVPIEVYRPTFFLKNPTPSLFESLQIVNGVRPQVNCNVCNTGDIHMNGLEGPYSMITIDGMPIVSGLATVYGLNGIPNSLVERMEIIKGPASTLYGSEAVGGLINVVTKSPESAPRVSFDVFGSSWGELNLDAGTVYKTGKWKHLLGISNFFYQQRIDNNGDGFTDIPLVNRQSIFHKSSLKFKSGESASIAFRVMQEDRWGGQTGWNTSFRGGDSVYGESIYTKRIELLGFIPFYIGKQHFRWQFSANWHKQDAYYGTTPYLGDQRILFQQLLWDRKIGKRHELLSGAAIRATWYDDNTTATSTLENNGTITNHPSLILLPGVFVQDEWHIHSKHIVLGGLRYDYNSLHGSILSPRINYKWTLSNTDNLRVSTGNGYRVVNIFTEDHAALTGARKVIIADKIKPEKSWNANIHYQHFVNLKNSYIQLEGSLFYTRFSNKIIPDYTTDLNSIIYNNLNGHAVSQGISINADWSWKSGIRLNAGATVMDVYRSDRDSTGNFKKSRQLLTEQFSATWALSIPVKKYKLSIDYTGNVYSPLLLPTLGPLDPRPAISPWFSVQNLQVTRTFKKNWEIYGGIKNILDFTPRKDAIARSFDPFDKKVTFDANGDAVSTPENPYALTFDPTYVYASNQGRRYFLGVRWKL